MSQTSIIEKRTTDHVITMFRGEQKLLKIAGHIDGLERLAVKWKEDITVNAAIEEAVKLGIL